MFSLKDIVSTNVVVKKKGDFSHGGMAQGLLAVPWPSHLHICCDVAIALSQTRQHLLSSVRRQRRRCVASDRRHKRGLPLSTIYINRQGENTALRGELGGLMQSSWGFMVQHLIL